MTQTNHNTAERILDKIDIMRQTAIATLETLDKTEKATREILLDHADPDKMHELDKQTKAAKHAAATLFSEAGWAEHDAMSARDCSKIRANQVAQQTNDPEVAALIAAATEHSDPDPDPVPTPAEEVSLSEVLFADLSDALDLKIKDALTTELDDLMSRVETMIDEAIAAHLNNDHN